MSIYDNKFSDKIKSLEHEIQKLTFENKIITENNESLQNNILYLKKEVNSKQKLIMYKTKLLQNYDKIPLHDCNTEISQIEMKIINFEDLIRNKLLSIQNIYNLSLNEKLKGESLMEFQKSLKVSYLIIKKIDLKDEFLIENRVDVSNNIFENMKNLSKSGLLNYRGLKSCGPILLFKLTEYSTFSQIKSRSCDIWNLNSSQYSLYDDSICNLDCLAENKISDFFDDYAPYDKTLKNGEICLYLIINLNKQTVYLDSQIKSIDLKSNSRLEELSKNENDNLFKIRKCIDLIKQKKILKGINCYKAIRNPNGKSIKKTMKMVDNYHIFILITILYITMSIVSITTKKNVVNWGTAMLTNNYLLSKYLLPNITNKFTSNLTYLKSDNITNELPKLFYNFSDYLLYYSYFFEEAIDINHEKKYILIGAARIRFMRTNMNMSECWKDFIDQKIVTVDNLLIWGLYCYSKNFIDYNRNESAIYNYNFSSNLGINYTLETPIGYYDNTGVVIDLYSNEQYNI